MYFTLPRGRAYYDSWPNAAVLPSCEIFLMITAFSSLNCSSSSVDGVHVLILARPRGAKAVQVGESTAGNVAVSQHACAGRQEHGWKYRNGQQIGVHR
jgi:hypothetical protein